MKINKKSNEVTMKNNSEKSKMLKIPLIPEGVTPELYSKEVWQESDGNLLLKVTYTLEIPQIWTDEETSVIPICLYNSLWEDELTEKQRSHLEQIFNDLVQRINAIRSKEQEGKSNAD